MANADADRSGTRVLYLSLEPLIRGQASHTHVHVVADGLARLGHAVTLIAEERAPAEALGGGKLARYWRLTRRCLAALRRADILYVRAHPLAGPAALAASVVGLPTVHEINGKTDDIGASYGLSAHLVRILRSAQRWQYRKAAALVAVTPGLADWARSETGSKVPVHMISNGADGETFSPQAAPAHPIAGHYAFFFGGLVAWHGIGTMLAAVKSPGWPADLRLAIAGHGPMFPQVEAAARLDARIMALGYLDRQEVAGLAAGSVAVLCPIENHGERDSGGVAPLKLFEGMAAGRPVIATDLPFQADLVRRTRCGVVIPVADPAALAAAVAALNADPAAADAMGRRGRRAIETEFDWRFRIADIAQVIGAIARKRKGQPWP